MKKKALFFIMSVGLALSFGMRAAAADHHAANAGHSVYTPDEVEWVDEPGRLPPGAKMAVLAGDPTKEGPFTFRLKLPDAYPVPHHWHPKPETITTITGTLHMGAGETADKDKVMPLTAGSFIAIDAEVKHYGWTEGETVIQVSSDGPFVLNYVNPEEDPSNNQP